MFSRWRRWRITGSEFDGHGARFEGFGPRASCFILVTKVYKRYMHTSTIVLIVFVVLFIRGLRKGDPIESLRKNPWIDGTFGGARRRR